MLLDYNLTLLRVVPHTNNTSVWNSISHYFTSDCTSASASPSFIQTRRCQRWSQQEGRPLPRRSGRRVPPQLPNVPAAGPRWAEEWRVGHTRSAMPFYSRCPVAWGYL